MDGGSRDVGETSRETSPKMGRRSFLKKGALAATGTALSVSALGSAAHFFDTKAVGQSSDSKPQEPISTAISKPEPAKFEDPIESRIKQMSQEERKVFEHITQSPIFKVYSKEDQLKAVDLVYAEVLENRKGDYLEIVRKTLDWKRFSKGFYKRANEIIKEEGEQVSPYTESLLLGGQDFMLPLIFVESRGEENAINAGKDKRDMGLCQVQDKTMQEIADKRKKGKLTDAQMLNPEINVPYGTYYLNKLTNVYRDFGIALWAYNLGDGHMRELIKAYVKSEKPDYYDRVMRVLNKENVEDFVVINPKTGKDERGEPAKLVDNKKLGLNLVELMTSEAAKSWLKANGIGEDNRRYVAKIAAANFVMDETVKNGDIKFLANGEAVIVKKTA